MTKKTDKLLKHINSLLLNLGAGTMSNGVELLTDLTTDIGSVRIHVETMLSARSMKIMLFCKFHNPTMARNAGFDCNAYTGKWNHFSIDSVAQIDTIIDELKTKAYKPETIQYLKGQYP